MESFSFKTIDFFKNPVNLCIISIISIVIFIIACGTTHFGGISILIFLITGIILFFVSKISFQYSGKFAIFVFGILCIIILTFGYGINSIIENKKNIDKNWVQYKCKPYILPFAGFFIGPNGTTNGENWVECFTSMFTTLFQNMMSPFIYIINSILNILKSLVGDINNIRKMINYLRENIKETIIDTYERLYDIYERITFMVKKIMTIFQKLFEVYSNMFDILVNMYYSFESIKNNKVLNIAGNISKFFCFDGNTKITTFLNKKKKIKNIKVGDKLDINNIVTGIMKFNSKNVQMYNYKDIIVAGSHKIYENNLWKRVYELQDAYKINNYNKKYIYCLLTTNSKIVVNNIVFSDYMETNDMSVKKYIYNMVLSHLNSTKIFNNYINYFINEYYDWGFNAKTKIKMYNNEFKYIKNIKIGDFTSSGIVIGKIKLYSSDIILYSINNNKMSGTTLIYENNKWMPVNQSRYALYIGKCREVLYNIITETNIIECDKNIIYRDYEQDGSNELNINIDNYVMNNSKSFKH